MSMYGEYPGPDETLYVKTICYHCKAEIYPICRTKVLWDRDFGEKIVPNGCFCPLCKRYPFDTKFSIFLEIIANIIVIIFTFLFKLIKILIFCLAIFFVIYNFISLFFPTWPHLYLLEIIFF